MSDTTPTPERKKAGTAASKVRLTPKEKAQAIALWRSGEATLEDLSKRFKKRPETFSRLFKKLSIAKGSAIAEAAAKLEEATISHAEAEHQESLRRLKAVRDEHFKMSTGLAKLAWAEIVRARQASLPLDTLKDTMATLKIAGDLIGNARKELFEILGAEKLEKDEELDDLPELTVRELTNNEIEQIQTASEIDEDVVTGDDLELED